MDTKQIEFTISKEVLHASAKAAQMPFETYVKRLLNDKEFTAPPLSHEVLTAVKLRVLLYYAEKELIGIKNNLLKIQKNFQSYSPDSFRLPQIKTKLDTIEKLLDKTRKLRLELNFYFG